MTKPSLQFCDWAIFVIKFQLLRCHKYCIICL
ncbi:hypothetical protein vBSenS3_57 [Salmonella phage vB_SenS-3]|uniref:Uncharacterized protein n=5 Tax=Caudoviricetes TaxID=2731619 RepID=A0A5J6TFG0_9CAUD|nr:hypothetical protein HWC37_gp165 [Salmonella phage vB_SenS_SB13]QFG07462.1 hypothetical protein [Salmonella phage vB_SenS_SB10]QFG07669.1 hypothetical protein [Salmonella phage vB_SenS_SB13]QIN93385.1 hypothetical protein vBSenS3_57 [Salmonella phage vB_SenS-3]QPI14888.1 hypothetical protein GECvBN3_gp064c [Salmonella phage GEC_vB_N3]